MNEAHLQKEVSFWHRLSQIEFFVTQQSFYFFSPGCSSSSHLLLAVRAQLNLPLVSSGVCSFGARILARFIAAGQVDSDESGKSVTTSIGTVTAVCF